MASPPRLVLVTGTTSSSSWRVRACLAFKGLAYETRVVDVPAGGARGESPMGQVPVLYADGMRLTQSVAIIEYLDHVHPAPPLFPRPAHLKAKCREVVELVNSGIQPLQNSAVLQRVQGGPDKQREWAQHFVAKGLRALEAALADADSGDFCLRGAEPTAADLFLVPQAFNALRYDVDLAAFPRVRRVFMHVGALPFMRSTAPPTVPAPPPTTAAPGGPVRVVRNVEAESAACRWLSLREVSYVDRRGVVRKWEAVERRTRVAGADADAVMIVAHVARARAPLRIPLVAQFRPATGRRTLEFPAGLLDPGETAEQAASRELLEETGLRAARVASVSAPLLLDPGMSNSALRAVVVDVDGDAPDNVDAKPRAPDDVEDVAVVWFDAPHTRAALERLARESGDLAIDANVWCWFPAVAPAL